VRIHNIECTRPVSFSGVKFTGDAIFNVNFKADADFSNAEFQGNASFAFSQFAKATFVAASFRGRADFTGTQFGLAYFWRAFFDGDANFVEMRVRQVGVEGERFLQAGESNFSFAKFAQKADFTRAIFEGPVYLVGTRFDGPVVFSEVKFRKSVSFYDGGENITIVRGDFANIVNGRWAGPLSGQLDDLGKPERDRLSSSDGWLFTRLLQAGVLHKSGEQFATENSSPVLVLYADFPAGQSESQWKARLEQARLTKAQLMVFDAVRKALARPMFLPNFDCSFELVEFPEQEQPHFRDTDLSHCRFFQSTLQRAQFVGVRWDRQPMLFGRRAALYDERHASTRVEFLELERLYTALQSQSEKDQTTGPPDEFQFGAMEMARRAGSGWRTFHKYLNAYNTSLLLPIIWLVLFLGGVFPLIYLLLGVVSNYTNALLHSLYLSSLLKDQTSARSSTPSRLAQVAQTLVVGLLLAAAGFVAKRKLGF
jgi:uncharacterized protein YjbI with pentapeptide repeats